MHRLVFFSGVFALVASTVFAQVTPAAGQTPPDDTPSIKVGVVIFGSYTYQKDPEITDVDGNVVNKSSFDVTRSYINVTGNISHIVAFRVTPDVSRENNTASSLAGSLEFRIKYAYLQTNLDDWMTKGSYARFGVQQTPYLDFIEAVYRYRFQGTMFVERANYFASADAGASFHYQFPSNYGDVHVGIFNGENYNKAEANDQKAVMIRATVRPFARKTPVLRGLRASIFYDSDHYVKHAPRKRAIGTVTYEHRFVTAGFEYLKAQDRTQGTKPNVKSDGYSIWLTPKTAKGWEGLIRYDHLTPNTASAFAPTTTSPTAFTPFESQKQNRAIVGVAYWFPHQGSISSAVLFDYDGQSFKNITTAPAKNVGVHVLVSF